MNLNEYKTSLSDIGGIQLLESFIKKETFNTDVPEYLDTMFVEQGEAETLVYLNDCKFKYSKLEESHLNEILKLVESEKYGSAVLRLNQVARPVTSLKEANVIVGKMLKFANDNLYIKESEGKKSLTEDWSRDFTRKSYKKAVMKYCKLTESGLVVGLREGSKSYLVEYTVNNKLANKVYNSFNYLGENYSRMILSDLVNVASVYHVTTRFDEKDALGGNGVYAITKLEVAEPDKLLITFVDRNSDKEYINTASLDLNVLKDDGLESAEELIEPYIDEIENMRFEDDIDYAVDRTNDIIADISAYFSPAKFGDYKATGKVDSTYSKGAYMAKTKRDAATNDVKTVGSHAGKAFVPYDIEWNRFKNKSVEQEKMASGEGIIIDGDVVENWVVKVWLRDNEGIPYIQAWEMKDSLREVLSLEEWYDELMEDLPVINSKKITFHDAYGQTRDFVKKLNRDAKPRAIRKPESDFEVESWLEEDAGCLQVSDVPAKVDYNEKPVIAESSEIVLEAWLIDLIARGFEPDSDGYLNRAGKYLVREKNTLTVKHHSELWEMDGTPIDENVDVVSILD